MGPWGRMQAKLRNGGKCLRSATHIATAALVLVILPGMARGQAIDCQRLRAQIAALDDSAARPNRYAAAAQRQRDELDRMTRYARSLGCDQQQFLFFGNPQPSQCPSLNAKIRQMQENLGQLQAAAAQGDHVYAKQDLISRYNAYCRGQAQDPTQPLKSFFESLFGFAAPSYQPSPAPPPTRYEEPLEADAEERPRGGSQAVCVRSCDGGFFPLDISARHADPEELIDLCRALCPNAEVRVFTKSPYKEIKTAVSLEDDEAYMDSPNALKFQRSFDPSCSCKAPRQSWVDALAGAEQLLGEDRHGDITVTAEKAAELSRPRPQPNSSKRAPPAVQGPEAKSQADRMNDEARGAAKAIAEPDPKGATGGDSTREIIGPDGLKRRVRLVGPTL